MVTLQFFYPVMESDKRVAVSWKNQGFTAYLGFDLCKGLKIVAERICSRLN